MTSDPAPTNWLCKSVSVETIVLSARASSGVAWEELRCHLKDAQQPTVFMSILKLSSYLASKTGPYGSVSLFA